MVVDKYCIGGLVGNCIMLVVVVIVIVLGLVMFKIFLCVIILLVGIVDIMVMFVLVELDLVYMCYIVECCGGCIVWGGVMNFVFVDDVLICVEWVLDVDSVGQLVVLVLFKKIVVGFIYVVIDVLVGFIVKICSDVEVWVL